MRVADEDLHRLFRTCAERGSRDAACEEFFRRSRPLFARIARRVAAQHGHAGDSEIDDQVQEVALKFCSSARSLAARLPAEPAAAQAYISIVAANVCRDWWKLRHSSKRSAARTCDLEGIADRVADARAPDPEKIALINAFESLLELSVRDRIVFNLRHREGYTGEEIASISAIGLTAKGVDSLLARLAEKARRKMLGGPPPGKEKRPGVRLP